MKRKFMFIILTAVLVMALPFEGNCQIAVTGYANSSAPHIGTWKLSDGYHVEEVWQRVK